MRAIIEKKIDPPTAIARIVAIIFTHFDLLFTL